MYRKIYREKSNLRRRKFRKNMKPKFVFVHFFRKVAWYDNIKSQKCRTQNNKIAIYEWWGKFLPPPGIGLKGELRAKKILYTICYIPVVPWWTLKFSPGNNFDHFSPGDNRKTVLSWNLTITGDAELVTGDPRWHNFLQGIFPLGISFTGVEASGALSRDVKIDYIRLHLLLHAHHSPAQQ